MSQKVFSFSFKSHLFPSSCHVVTGNTNRQQEKHFTIPKSPRTTTTHSQTREKLLLKQQQKERPRYLRILCLFTPIVYSVSPTPPRDCKTNNPDGQLLILCIGKESGWNVFAVAEIEMEKTAQ
ncbi:hypothetical protein CEXT_326871 [Caerostris extrusa]|uniref:Uncharacterized protein n=1 Tax=Caerostris extrusa TaxID=172846 RepID=A0AAV4T3W6_CAEEX|nr:hypothetical protein CEXT_326871 [Caerostris extrusa]